MHTATAVERHGSIRGAARALGVDPKTIRNRLAKEAGIKPAGVPKAALPTRDLIERLTADSRRKQATIKAETWQRVHVADKRPVGLLWFGDPHLGVSTLWDRLERDMALCLSEPGLYAANIGDTANWWGNRLIHLAAEEPISRKQERQLARWFLAESGMPWLLWLMGNHDEWGDADEFMREMNVHGRVNMRDWEARIELCFPNKKKIRIHAAHDFPGNSMWNVTHGPSRAAQMMSDADLYVCGHKHCWGVQQFELPWRERSPTLIRVRGYKFGDEFARRHGYPECNHGSSILTIFCPDAEGPGRVLTFTDVEQGARVLRALRGGK